MFPPLSVFVHVELIPPQVRLLLPSCEDSSTEELELVCLLMNFSPEKATVEWLVNGVKKELPGMPYSSGKGTDDLYRGHSQVNITRESWDKGDVYTCKVTHSAWDVGFWMSNISKCSGEGS